MARGINKVILIGNLGADPETRAMPSGMTVANIRVATSENWKDKQSGENKERTEWHRVAMFGRLGEIAGEYLKKGRQVYIEGRIEYGSYEKDGVKHYTTDIIGEEMQMLGGRSEGRAEPREESGQRSARPQQRSDSAPRREMPAQRPAPMDDFADDDIPF